MDKLRIAVFLNDDYNPNIGGGFSYYDRLIKKIDLHKFDDIIEVCFLSKVENIATNFTKEVIEIPYSKFKLKHWNFKSKMTKKIFSFSILKHFKIHQKIENKINQKIENEVKTFLADNKIDLIYYATPDFYPINYPYILTHWDLGHKTMFAFPEIINGKKFEKREFHHRVTLQRAFAIFVESEQSKDELIHFEKINEQRIFVLPMFAGKVVELNLNTDEQQNILNKWQLKKQEFYFYPAQFWAHKNHYVLIKAFKKVLQEQTNFKLVLSGSDKGNLDYIKSIVETENIQKNVIFAGFVSNDEVFTFYKNTIALVMPTLLGPTNMPLLEAYYLGCKVLCSNLVGHKQQMEKKVVYFNPFDEQELAQKMLETIKTEKILLEEEILNIGTILNQNFKNLYNVRKTFGYGK